MVKKFEIDDIFKVLCQIYYHNINDEPIWYSKLNDELEGKLNRNLGDVLNDCNDWGFLRLGYGITENGNEGRLFEIDTMQVNNIKDMYNRYWKSEVMTENYDYVIYTVSILEKVNETLETVLKRIDNECDLNEIKNELYSDIESVLSITDDDGSFLEDVINDSFEDTTVSEFVNGKVKSCLKKYYFK